MQSEDGRDKNKIKNKKTVGKWEVKKKNDKIKKGGKLNQFIISIKLLQH